MTKLFTEEQVTIETLRTHFTESGITVEYSDENSLGVRSQRGCYIYVRIDDERKFIRFDCYIKVDESREHLFKLEKLQYFNYELFLASFALDADNDNLIVNYVMSFELGIIAGQMMHVYRRFSGLIDRLRSDENEDGFLLFSRKSTTETETETETVTYQ